MHTSTLFAYNDIRARIMGKHTSSEQNPEILKNGPRAETISICRAVALGGFHVAASGITAAIPGTSIRICKALNGVLQSVKMVTVLAFAEIPAMRGWMIFSSPSSPSSLNLMEISFINSVGTPLGVS